MEKYVIIAGAGVSVDSPSEVPMAIPIMESIIKAIAPNDSIEKDLLQKDIRKNIDSGCKLSGDFLRFETLMDAVSFVDKNLEVLDAFKNYKYPNLNHYNLAKLAIEGHYVFTPNFDDLIERAIYNLGYDPLTICTKNDYESFSFRNKGKIPVFKLHGGFYRYIGEGNHKKISKETIQASLKSIITGNEFLTLESFKSNFLKNCLRKSSKLIFFGYSGADDFDIVPTLLNLEINKILWVNHSDKECVDNVVNKYLAGDNGRPKLLRKQYEIAAESVEVYDTNTRKFLSDLGGMKEIKRNILHKVNVSFQEHIANWSLLLTEEEKLFITGKIYQSLDFYEKAQQLFSKISSESNYYVDGQINISLCLDQRGRYKEALQMLQSLKEYKNIEKSKKYLEIISGEAFLNYRISGSNPKYEPLYKEVLRKAGKQESLLQNTMNNYALFLRDLGRNQEAEFFFKQSDSYAEKMGDLQRRTWVVSDLANMLYDEGKIVKADRWAQKGIKQAELLGDHRQVGVFENLLANILFIRGNYESAIEYCKKSINRDKYLDNEVDSSVNELLLGQCYYDLNDYPEAFMHYDKSLQLFLLSDDCFYLYELLFYLIIYYLKTLDFVKAEQTLLQFSGRISGNQVEAIYYKIAKQMVEFFVSGTRCSFKEVLHMFVNNPTNKETIGYINAVWYLAELGIPSCLIGKQLVVKAAKMYKRYGNQRKSDYLYSII